MSYKALSLACLMLAGGLEATGWWAAKSNGRQLALCCGAVSQKCARACAGKSCDILCDGTCGILNIRCGPYKCSQVTTACASSSATTPATTAAATTTGGGGGGWPQEPEAESNYNARGEMVDLDPNMKGYLVGSGQKVVVWSTGMYGITGDNNKKKRTKEWADFLAEEGGYTVLIPDWFRGNNMQLGPFGPVFGPEMTIWSRQVTNSTRILDDWQNVVLPYLEAKLTSNLNIGLIGTCWGSYPVVYLSRFDNIKVGISMHASHPGLIMSVNETESEVLSQIVAPQLFMTEGSYGVPGIEVPPSILPGGLADQVLGDKIQFEVFTDMKHGWTTGGDLSDPDVARDVDKAKTLALEVLAKYL